MYKIYAVKLKDNDTIYYIGQTSKKISIRRTQHFSAAKKKKTKFYNWLRSVNFLVEFEVLFEFKTKEEVDKKEIELIANMKNLKNTSQGGDSGPIFFRSKNGNSKKVLQYSLDGEFLKKFDSFVDAQEKTGVKAALISNCVTMDRVKSVGGFMWKNFKPNFPTKIPPYKKNIMGNKKNSKPIIQLSKNNEILKEWISIREAARELGIFKQGINLCLKNKINTYKGFKWINKII